MAKVMKKKILRDSVNENDKLSFKRVCLNPAEEAPQGVNDNIVIDHIEINSRMNLQAENFGINEMSEQLIMFGFATLYASACPIAAFLIIVYNIIDINSDIYRRQFILQRPKQ